MMRCSTSDRRALAAVVFALAVLGSTGVRAEQFTMFDITYEARKDNTHDAHFDVKPPMFPLTQPDNWTAPIDYTKGTVYIEQDVMTKPSAEETQVDICFLTGKGYGCRNTELYTTTGRHTTIRAVTRFNAFNQIDWTKKIPLVQFIVKDKANKNGGAPVEKFMPTKMRIAMIFVSAGDTYKLPADWTAGPGDGGVPPDASAGGQDAGATPDAAAPADTAAAAVDTAPRADTAAPATPTPDAGSKPKNPTPAHPDAAAEDPERPEGRATGGCAVAGGGARQPAVLLAMGLALAATLVRRRGRR